MFLIKENRTFDTYFGLFPGADGAARGRRCNGAWVHLRQASDQQVGPAHSFAAGGRVVNGGKMNCFDALWEDAT